MRWPRPFGQRGESGTGGRGGRERGKGDRAVRRVLRSIDLTMCGSGFGSVPLAKIIQVIPTLFSLAAGGHLKVAVEPVPLEKVEEAWGRAKKESGSFLRGR